MTKSCELLIEHIKSNVCDHNEDWFNYFMSYFAHMHQRPDERPGIAMVITGSKGCGKSFVVEAIQNTLLPNESLTAPDVTLKLNFNNALYGVNMLVLTEQDFSDEKQNSLLKNAITSDKLVIHQRGYNEKIIHNRIRYCITSNGKADLGRRLFILNCLPAKVGDPMYFKRIWDELQEGGYSALRDYFLNWTEPTVGWTEYLANPPLTPWNSTR